MHSLISGFMGMVMGFGGFFHGGAPVPHNANNVQVNAQAGISGTPGFGHSARRAFSDERGGLKLHAGERPFFGTVTSVNGSTLTIQMMGMMMWKPKANITPTITPRSPKTFTVNLDGNTKYTGGGVSDITTNTRIAGIGKSNSDGSLTAISVQINPAIPTGFPGRGHNRGGFRPQGHR